MEYKNQYCVYQDLCRDGSQVVHTKDITADTIDQYFYGLINILKDGIELDEVQSMMLHIIFVDKEEVDLTIFDFLDNLIFWYLNTGVGSEIYSYHIVFPEDITKKYIANYINNIFISKYRRSVPFIDLNQTIDSAIGKFRDLREFQMYLSNTLNLEDSIELMKKYPEFNDTIHFDVTGIPLEDIKDAGMKAADIQIEYIKNSDHCLRDSFRTGEAISAKQYKEVAVNIGTKPDGQGSVFPHPIIHSFMNGGLQTPEEITVESSVGRIAQILQKNNVGESGAFARRLELNNQDTFLYPDPDYVCDTRNFQEIVVEDSTMLSMFDLRYYRENPLGIDKFLEAKNSKHLIGKKIYLRSPMTCASAARGDGVCYKCYGDLAFVNSNINIGMIAAESLSSIYTQILLSAKHLLESLVIKMEWVNEFFDIFEINFNAISVKDLNFKGWKMIIEDEVKQLEEIDDALYNYYVEDFLIEKPDGSTINIHTTEADNIYLMPEFVDYIKTFYDINEEEDPMEFDLDELRKFDAIFKVEVKNNELSATMDKIEKLIDNKTTISKFDRNSILYEFITTNIAGNIILNSVHFEILLMNQIRHYDDLLEMPDWTNPNEPYQILSLSNSLVNNRSIGLRLQSEKIQKILTSPDHSRLHKPAMVDLFYMEQPQEYLSDKTITSDEYEFESDKDESVVEPIIFDNPKIRVGRDVKKRKNSY